MQLRTTLVTVIVTTFLLGAAENLSAQGPSNPSSETRGQVNHVKVYFEKGMYGGWPANHGIWSWRDEILVGFTKGYYKDLGPTRHHMDREKPELHMLARSLDGGETWTIEDPGAAGHLLIDGGFLQGIPREGAKIPELRECEGGIDFTHPDFALTVRTDNIDSGVSRYFYSYDRGKKWVGPCRLPNFGAPGTAARTDYIVNGRHDCMLFITAAKSNGEEGRPLCVQTTDGGASWNLVSWIGPEPKGFSIMPASVRLSPSEILVAVRNREGFKRWIGSYLSQDNGRSWQPLEDPVSDTGIGNPPALIRLRDGRLCLIYGYRAEPYSIRARLSSDQGRSWSEDIVLRDDGANRDIGYPRAVQRPDGKIVTVYYFNDRESGPERYIAATVWNPFGESQGSHLLRGGELSQIMLTEPEEDRGADLQSDPK